MSFKDDLNRFELKVSTDANAAFVNIASHVLQSVVDGSPVTGAPGQPVDTGNLRNSWVLSFPSLNEATIQTNVVYAPYVEDNVNNVTFKNHGPHSVKLTVAGFPLIVEAETKKVSGI